MRTSLGILVEESWVCPRGKAGLNRSRDFAWGKGFARLAVWTRRVPTWATRFSAKVGALGGVLAADTGRVAGARGGLGCALGLREPQETHT